MTDIIITVQNPDQVDIAEIRRDFWRGMFGCVYRGARSADIRKGERVYLQYHGSLWGFVYFDRYDMYGFKTVHDEYEFKDNAIFLTSPMHRFDVPVDLRGKTTNSGWRYVDPTKYSPETMKELRQQTKIAESRPGWFGAEADYLQPDPAPFTKAQMETLRACVRENNNVLTTREALVDYITNEIIEDAKGVPTYAVIARHAKAGDWDEAIAHTLCVMTDDMGTTVEPGIPILRNGAYLYCECAQMEYLGAVERGWRRKWQSIRNEEGVMFVFDPFSCEFGECDTDDRTLDPFWLWRTARLDRVFGMDGTGCVFPLEPRPKNSSKPSASTSAAAKPAKPKTGKRGE